MITSGLVLAALAPLQIAAFGLGAGNCASVLAPAQYDRAFGWVMGYFSGANSVANAAVGSSGDGDIIMVEVDNACRSTPTLTLIGATEQAYVLLRDEQR